MTLGEYYGQHNSHADWLKIASGRSIKHSKPISKTRYYYNPDSKPRDDNYEPYF